MKMNDRTGWYFRDWNRFRAGLREIWQKYDQDTAQLEAHRGSRYYTECIEKLEKERQDAIQALRAEYRREFSVTIDGMRKSILSRPAIPPSADQVAILSVLKMREKVSQEELEQAARALADNDFALAALEDISSSKGIKLRLPTTKTALVLQHVDDLADSANRLLALEKADSRREMTDAAHRNRWETGNHNPNVFYSYMTDQDVSSENEVLTRFGFIKSEDIPAFLEAVNR
jgi:hypothetical protein